MQNLFEDLVAVLGTDDRLVADGHVMKNKVVELALRLDADLLRLVRSHDRLRQHFFVEVDGVAIFDKVKFQQFVSNKAFLPDSYTAFKNKIGLMDGEQYLAERQDVVLAWPYKDCVLEGGQDREDAQRLEVFWNETLAPDQIDRLLTPKVLVGAQRYTQEGAAPAENLSTDDNLIIKGNNLLALHTLMPMYEGKVQLVCIDPPYNTETDTFNYNDRFNHSTWLTFMKSRLETARRILHANGVFAPK
jgi:adenine-specific DNA-methyltransferase